MEFPVDPQQNAEQAISSLHPELVAKLRLDEDFWQVGDPGARIITESGSTYFVRTDGAVFGSNGVRVIVAGQLNGAVYRPGGPIRTKCVVYGLSMEIRYGAGRTIITTPVVAIEDVKS